MRKLWRGLKYLILTVLFITFLGPEWPAFGDTDYRLDAIVGQRHFDFWAWHINAYVDKGAAVLAEGQAYVPTAQQKEIVLGYLDLIREARLLEREIDAIYTDPAISDPDAASQDLQETLAETRQLIVEQQNIAEAIIQEQVAIILAEEGFSLTNSSWPPVLMQMTPLPSILIVSPRDRIERVDGVSLENGVSVPDRDAIETAVFTQLNQSALVVPIGGLGTYPAMIAETSNLNWLVEVTAHEWAHHWLGLQPLGLNYLTSSELRTMNETVASIIDVEIGEQVIARYYPERVPPPPSPPPAESDNAETAPEPPPFDFRAEMAETRIRVDELLAEGEIELAEEYMEERREIFVENGYRIRKLNQAYFAFYGAYAAQPGGATGLDPVGPLVRKVRAASPSLRAFMDTMAPITSLTELKEVAAQLR
ncbi:MAG: hypothetical protein AAF614_14050 [Chloroflexota bacterium]